MTPTSIPTRSGRRALGAALAAALVLAAGCGSDDADAPADADAAPAQPASSTLRVTETDFAIAPEEGHLDEPGAVRVAVINRGEARHALAIETPDGIVRTERLQ